MWIYMKSGNKCKDFLLMDFKDFKKVLLKAVWIYVGDFWISCDLFPHSKRYLPLGNPES